MSLAVASRIYVTYTEKGFLELTLAYSQQELVVVDLGHNLLRILVTIGLSGRLEGLCGNFNMDYSDDLLPEIEKLPMDFDASQNEHLVRRFVRRWLSKNPPVTLVPVEGECQIDFTPPENPCDKSPTLRNFVFEHCTDILKDLWGSGGNPIIFLLPLLEHCQVNACHACQVR